LKQLPWGDPPPKPAEKTLEKISGLKARNRGEKAFVLRKEMQKIMMDGCSVFRMEDRLSSALTEIRRLKGEYKKVIIDDRGSGFNSDLLEAIELESLLGLAEVILVSAMNRRESRGAHYREDFPRRTIKIGFGIPSSGEPTMAWRFSINL